MQGYRVGEVDRFDVFLCHYGANGEAITGISFRMIGSSKR